MAITEVRSLTRSAVGWFSALAIPQELVDLCTQRGLSIAKCVEADLENTVYLAGLAAVILLQDPDKPTRVPSQLNTYAKSLLDYDCQVLVHVASAVPSPDGLGTLSYLSLITRIVDQLELPCTGISVLDPKLVNLNASENPGVPPLPHIYVYGQNAPWSSVVNALAAGRHTSAPNANLKIVVEGEQNLSGSEEILLRRAFADCSEIHLVPMLEGRSGVGVYKAYADLTEGVIGPWPLPYFIKIGARGKIFKEYQNYQAVVDPYIPFHLGPHLIHERCHLGATTGILVGDFVDQAETISSCASTNRAAQAISCLFNTSLNGWYRAATDENASLHTLLKFPASPVSPQRIALAKTFGASKTLFQLECLYQTCAATSPTLVGPAHGDLHAGNILVRGSDAILIDFLAHKYLPLVYDVACLETSLLIDGFSDDARDIQSWCDSVANLYDGKILEQVCATTHPKDQSQWFFTCVSQIRLYAKRLERQPGQYAAALAVALLKKAGKDPALPEPENSRRAVAYYFAEKLLTQSPGVQAIAQPAASTSQINNLAPLAVPQQP